MSAYLQTQDLSVGYDGKALIQNVCLEVQKGKIVTLIGPNGSGKSTILKTIVGQLGWWRMLPWTGFPAGRSPRKWPLL